MKRGGAGRGAGKLPRPQKHHLVGEDEGRNYLPSVITPSWHQQPHLLLQTDHALGGEEGLDEGGGGGRGLLPLLGGGGGRVLVQVGGGGAGVPALQLVQLGGQPLLHGHHLLHADADLAPHVLAAHPQLRYRRVECLSTSRKKQISTSRKSLSSIYWTSLNVRSFLAKSGINSSPPHDVRRSFTWKY